MMYKVMYYNHISDKVYTLEQAKKLVEHLNITVDDCNAHMIEYRTINNQGVRK